ncbi:hypothetical protein HDU97_002046 [Phlyctochytrium planicorne]|nr:hypothetical protein HDU97_002046 [Phlyctochytrium planicorne]
MGKASVTVLLAHEHRLNLVETILKQLAAQLALNGIEVPESASKLGDAKEDHTFALLQEQEEDAVLERNREKSNSSRSFGAFSGSTGTFGAGGSSGKASEGSNKRLFDAFVDDVAEVVASRSKEEKQKQQQQQQHSRTASSSAASTSGSSSTSVQCVDVDAAADKKYTRWTDVLKAKRIPYSAMKEQERKDMDRIVRDLMLEHGKEVIMVASKTNSKDQRAGVLRGLERAFADRFMTWKAEREKRDGPLTKSTAKGGGGKKDDESTSDEEQPTPKERRNSGRPLQGGGGGSNASSAGKKKANSDSYTNQLKLEFGEKVKRAGLSDDDDDFDDPRTVKPKSDIMSSLKSKSKDRKAAAITISSDDDDKEFDLKLSERFGYGRTTTGNKRHSAPKTYGQSRGSASKKRRSNAKLLSDDDDDGDAIIPRRYRGTSPTPPPAVSFDNIYQELLDKRSPSPPPLVSKKRPKPSSDADLETEDKENGGVGWSSPKKLYPPESILGRIGFNDDITCVSCVLEGFSDFVVHY